MNAGGLERGIAELDRRARAVIAKPGAEISGLSLVVVREGVVAFEGCYGRRRIDAADPANDLPVDSLTKFRIASMSKPVAGVGAMILAERGLLDLDADLSGYLGFELRNPHWPGAPISASMLLSHVSTLRDADVYNIPLGGALSDMLSPEGPLYEGGLHFASPAEGPSSGPGDRYCYCNLNYGVLATAMEAVTGKRFDLLMRELVFGPLGLDASHNVLSLSDEGFAHLATLYRKSPDDGADSSENWDPAGPWIPQFDDHRGKRPASPCRLAPGVAPGALADYRPGTNGTLFSPQGGLRISARDYAVIMRLLMGGGQVDGKRLLSPEGVGRMMNVRWKYDAARANGSLGHGLGLETGLALMRGTDTQGVDRLLPGGGGPRMWGHHADAYGLLGGTLFDPGTGFGFVYIIGGTAFPPENLRGRYSSFFLWEEELHAAILEELGDGRV